MKNFGMGKSGKEDDSKYFPAFLMNLSSFAPLRLCANPSRLGARIFTEGWISEMGFQFIEFKEWLAQSR